MIFKRKTISIDLFSETSHLKPYFTPSLALLYNVRIRIRKCALCVHMACFLNVGIQKQSKKVK